MAGLINNYILNFKTVEVMLRIKSTYPLLYIFLIQLGCSSSYSYQMEGAGGSRSGARSSGGKAETSSEDSEDEDTENKIRGIMDKFLKKQGQNVKHGVTISRKAIELAIDNINENDQNINTVDINSLPIEYIQFLNKHGCIHGKGHAISGPTGKNTNTNEKKSHYIASLQRGFKKSCIRLNKELERVQSYWLIADINDTEQCYIDVSDTRQGRGRIYSIDRMGNSRLFARDFTEFLTRFCESFSLRQANISSAESD